MGIKSLLKAKKSSKNNQLKGERKGETHSLLSTEGKEFDNYDELEENEFAYPASPFSFPNTKESSAEESENEKASSRHGSLPHQPLLSRRVNRTTSVISRVLHQSDTLPPIARSPLPHEFVIVSFLFSTFYSFDAFPPSSPLTFISATCLSTFLSILIVFIGAFLLALFAPLHPFPLLSLFAISTSAFLIVIFSKFSALSVIGLLLISCLLMLKTKRGIFDRGLLSRDNIVSIFRM
ncbi:hypothetical protein PENTCL1PPCAC_5229 [Pristionchus entomophagus]|uniref:Uncharacterized protein n=1 Tax=Pristionchus entomophagus TaxID=358040 RepID=A0AAV5SP05_9BILA|nr:hypothetical protein PENTCL1PPCAC_5229 [Pristionchus entomophagus]